MRTTIVAAMVALALFVVVVVASVTASPVSAGFSGGKGIAHVAPPPHRGAQLSADVSGGKGVRQTAAPPHRPKFGVVDSA